MAKVATIPAVCLSSSACKETVGANMGTAEPEAERDGKKNITGERSAGASPRWRKKMRHRYGQCGDVKKNRGDTD